MGLADTIPLESYKMFYILMDCIDYQQQMTSCKTGFIKILSYFHDYGIDVCETREMYISIAITLQRPFLCVYNNVNMILDKGRITIRIKWN